MTGKKLWRIFGFVLCLALSMYCFGRAIDDEGWLRYLDLLCGITNAIYAADFYVRRGEQ